MRTLSPEFLSPRNFAILAACAVGAIAILSSLHLEMGTASWGYTNGIDALGSFHNSPFNDPNGKPPKNTDEGCEKVFKGLKTYQRNAQRIISEDVTELPNFGNFFGGSGGLGDYGMALFGKEGHVAEWADWMSTWCSNYDVNYSTKHGQSVIDIHPKL